MVEGVVDAFYKHFGYRKTKADHKQGHLTHPIFSHELFGLYLSFALRTHESWCHCHVSLCENFDRNLYIFFFFFFSLSSVSGFFMQTIWNIMYGFLMQIIWFETPVWFVIVLFVVHFGWIVLEGSYSFYVGSSVNIGIYGKSDSMWWFIIHLHSF